MRIDRARLYDKRVVQRNIRAERVTKDEYAAWLSELPDVSDKIKPRDEGGDDDGYEANAGKATDAPADATVTQQSPAQQSPAQQSPAQVTPTGDAG